MKKLQLFRQNHGLSPLQKYQFCLLFKCMFILSRKACSLTRMSPNTFSGFILHNTKRSKKFHFLTKTMDQPLWKNANFVVSLNRCFRCSERLVCYIKRRKSFFHHLFSRSMTWEYRGLQGITRGCKGLQGVTGGYKGWQGVTRGDRGLQRIIQVEEIPNFDQNNGLTPLQKFSFSVFHKQLFL